MKEEKNKIQKPLSEFQRYVRGEMTKRQENAFQKKLQKDPFASEASEGYSEISADEADMDMKQLEKRLKKRVTSRRYITFYRIAASIAVLMIIASVYLFIDRNKHEEEISKESIAASKSDVVDAKKDAEPGRQVTGIIAESQEVTTNLNVSDAVAISTEAEPVSEEILAFREKQDTSAIIQAGQIALAEREDSVIEIAADQVNEPAVIESDEILAEYKAEEKNARAAGAVAAKSVLMEAGNTPPLPVTGKGSFENYLRENIRLPGNMTPGDSAVVVISFTVTTGGTFDSFRVLSSPGDDFSNEARRLLTEGPAWNPAIRNGEKTDEEVRLDIIFKKK